MKIMQMDGQERQVTLVWLGLVALTLGSAWLGEGLASIGITAALVALIRYYMGLAGRGSRLGQVMRLYFVVVPLLILLAGGAGAVLS